MKVGAGLRCRLERLADVAFIAQDLRWAMEERLERAGIDVDQLRCDFDQLMSGEDRVQTIIEKLEGM